MIDYLEVTVNCRSKRNLKIILEITSWLYFLCVRSSHQRCTTKKAVFKNFAMFTRKFLYWSLFFKKVLGLKACNFIKKKLQQVFSCECCEIFKNAYFEEHLRTAASVCVQGMFFFCLSPVSNYQLLL